MQLVLLTAFGVGGATIIGALIGFIFKNISHKFTDYIMGFAAGVMLSAAVIGLVIPSLEYGAKPYAVIVTIVGIFCGALCLNLLDKLIPHLHGVAGMDGGTCEGCFPGGKSSEQLDKILLFVLAIGIHNLPEGIAAGVTFGTDNVTEAIIVAAGIALQNIPEGMVIIAPMLAVGVKPLRTFLIAASTGLIEVLGTLLGFFAVNISVFILPFALAFAGGTMIYVVSDEMIPETHAHGNERGATYALLIGFCVMVAMDYLLG
ncbi:MAG: ZIP family metal transporter [Firmicutes bacterium]|nr:ZIP family metal transporter [Bacillota bacterium]